MRQPFHAGPLLVTVFLFPPLPLGNWGLIYPCRYLQCLEKGGSYSPTQWAVAVLVCKYINQSKAKPDWTILCSWQETRQIGKVYRDMSVFIFPVILLKLDIHALAPLVGISFAYKSSEIISRIIYQAETGDGCLAWCESPHWLRWDLTPLPCNKKLAEGNMGKYSLQTSHMRTIYCKIVVKLYKHGIQPCYI